MENKQESQNSPDVEKDGHKAITKEKLLTKV